MPEASSDIVGFSSAAIKNTRFALRTMILQLHSLQLQLQAAVTGCRDGRCNVDNFNSAAAETDFAANNGGRSCATNAKNVVRRSLG